MTQLKRIRLMNIQLQIISGNSPFILGFITQIVPGY